MARPRRFDWLFRPQLAAEDMPLSAETRFAEALADLPAVERSALALSEIGGLDPNEIAERLGTDPVIVRKVLARARESVRTTLAVRSRRGLTALIPFQSWWQTGSSAPAVRAAGAVAAAVVGTTVAMGSAPPDGPRSVLTSPDPPAARTLAAAPVSRATPRISGLAVKGVPPTQAAPPVRPVSTPAPAPAPAPETAPRPSPATTQAAPPPAVPSPPHVVAAEPEHGAPSPPEPAPDRPAVTAPVAAAAVDSAAAPVPVPVPATPVVPVPVPPPTAEPAALPAVPVPPVPTISLPEASVTLP